MYVGKILHNNIFKIIHNSVVVSWVLLILGTQIIICKLFFVSNDSADLKTIIIDNRLVIYCMYFI